MYAKLLEFDSVLKYHYGISADEQWYIVTLRKIHNSYKLHGQQSAENNKSMEHHLQVNIISMYFYFTIVLTVIVLAVILYTIEV